MADTKWTAFSSENAFPFFASGRQVGRPDNGFRHDRNALYLPAGTQPDTGDCATLVVPKPVPRVAGTASMCGMHEFVMRLFER
jgi:hypothetical protein